MVTDLELRSKKRFVLPRAESEGLLSTMPVNHKTPRLQRPGMLICGARCFRKPSSSRCRVDDPADCGIATFGTLASFLGAHNLSGLAPGSFAKSPIWSLGRARQESSGSCHLGQERPRCFGIMRAYCLVYFSRVFSFCFHWLLRQPVIADMCVHFELKC